ncbi:BQ2448_5246 [Microbotryum intermedium]|uniref:RNA helicase n=1 Tax=Microbotryum intermedium TaxID=269621 RepID=A0A238F3P0_9BASI|nr:BQ2448_5246 [Microbotryum intermedium]
MPRSPSPTGSSSSASKRRRYDDDSHYSSSSRRTSGTTSSRDVVDRRHDRGRDRDRRSDRDRDRDSESRRSSGGRGGHLDDDRRRDDRDRSKDYDRDRDRNYGSSSLLSRYDRRDAPNSSRYNDDHRSPRHDYDSPRDRDKGGRYGSTSSTSHPHDTPVSSRRPDDRSPLRPSQHSPRSRAFSPTTEPRSSTPISTSNGRTDAASPTAPSSTSVDTNSASAAEQDKLRLKQERLAAWKAKKAAEQGGASPAPATPAPASGSASISINGAASKNGLPAKPAAAPVADPAQLALAAAAAISSRLNVAPPSLKNPISASLPARPAFAFNNNASSSSFRPSGLKNSLKLGEDDDGEKKIGLIKFDGEVDLSLQDGGEEDLDDDEDLEGGVVFKGKVEDAMRRRAKELELEERKPDGMEVDDGDEEGKEVKEEDRMDQDGKVKDEDEEEEVDELDAFMNSVQAEVKSVDKLDRAKLKGANGPSGSGPGENEDEDDDEDEKVVEDDEAEKVGMSAADILALAAKKVKKGRELPPVDHAKVNYEPFTKIFYHEPPEVASLTPEEVDELRLELDDINIRGADPPKPVSKWSYCGLPAACIDVIKGLEYTAPTSIQAQAIPAIMSGRDIIGVAKTGSGKTIAFLLPMFRHIKDQRPLRTMEGPIAMIMTPTRELATQIHKECKPFLKALGLRASCAYGGTPLKDNIADMKRGSELIVCTPGRMIELLTTNSGKLINLHRVTYLVLDEADRMFDMGFEPQVMKIISQIRPDRQTVLFSATFPRQMEALARKILKRPLEITVGGRSVVAAEIEQIVEVREEDTKFNRMLELLGNLFNDDSDSRALIFVERQESADKLLSELLRKNYSCMSLHGGMDQVDRDQTIADFKSGIVPVVIATSVAARGLDVKQLRLVIQYDAPNHMEDYVHRAGRTGRAGNKGTSVTFLTPEQDRYALDIFKALQASNAPIPDAVKALAEQFADKIKAGKASAGSGFGGKGLERLESDRDEQMRAQRAAHGEPGVDKEKEVIDPETGVVTTSTTSATTNAAGDELKSTAQNVADLEVEIHRGPAPDTNKMTGSKPVEKKEAVVELEPTEIAAEAARVAEAAARAAGKTEAEAKAAGVAANFNALLKARKTHRREREPQDPDLSTDAARRRDPDATDYHAIIYINDYPQKARWKVTNKETMVHLVESTGASITNKGTYYEPGKEPGPGDLPKLHFLIESNDEHRVKAAITEIKRALIEGATLALEAEQRLPAGTNAPGRYNVV